MTKDHIRSLEDMADCAQQWISPDDNHLMPLPDNWQEALNAARRCQRLHPRKADISGFTGKTTRRKK